MSTVTFDPKQYIQKEYGSLIGAKILSVRALTASEIAELGWDDGQSSEVPFVLMLDNGLALIPSMDPEGNGAGHVFVESWK